MKKRILLSQFAIALVLSLCSCAGTSESDTQSLVSNPFETSENENSETPANDERYELYDKYQSGTLQFDFSEMNDAQNIEYNGEKINITFSANAANNREDITIGYMAFIGGIPQLISVNGSEEAETVNVDFPKDEITKVSISIKPRITKELEDKKEPSLENSTFYIKDYQRGYRWEEQQVKSLLDDLLEFNHDNHTLKYCMQPLVVKKAERNAVAHTRTLSELITPDAVKSEETESSNCDSAWELIDGQQRLTTTLLVLNCCYEALKKPPAPPYQIYYQLIRNIDEYYINHAKKVIDDWFDSFGSKSDDIRSEIRGKINSDIQFIWYEVESNANSVEIFTKLNIGKIPLTNAELFKAQLLNPDRIDKKDREKEVKENVTLASIAFEWDKIEQSLRDNDFWSFISNEMLDAETRIDYLLRLYAIQIKYEGEIDSAIQEADGLFPFLAINSYIRKHKMDSNSIACNETIWKEIVSIHDRLKSWYTNNKLYHYIGFLIATGKSGIKVITELVKDTDKKKKSEVKEIVFDKIRKQMKNVTLDNLSYSKDSQRIRSVLLFFNLFTMVQSKTDSRFSFKQYKDPKIHWDIEHIHARATDEEIRAIKDPDKRKDFLESLKKQFEEINDQEAVQKINQFILTEVSTNNINEDEFLDFCCKITDKYGNYDENGIGNLTLLDAETNRSYHNALYPIKRIRIIERDKGEVFIPVCTKNVFLKMYSSNFSNMMEWTKDDAEDYLSAMKKALVEEAGVCQ